jgi:hypothetical protein
MLSFLPGPVKGVLLLGLYVINTIFWTMVVFSVALLKLCVPVPAWRKLCSKVMIGIGNIWIFFNNCTMRFINKIHWDVDGTDGLKMNRWYLVVANHLPQGSIL